MKYRNITSIRNQRGSILLPFIITLPVFIIIVVTYMDLTVSNFRLARIDQFHTGSQLAADAAADYAVGQISTDADWSGTGGEITLANNSDVKTTYSATVANNGADSKTITAIGRTYKPATATTPQTSVTLKIGLRPVRSGLYSVIAGVGGLYMSNSSKITGGDVFVNGEVSLSNSAQIGLSTNPVNLTVAHQVCPNPANGTYPRLCNNGENGQPITLNNSAHIYGTVRANNQTNGAGMTNAGLVSSSGVTAQALPTHDRDAQKAAAVNNLTGSAASCSGSQTRTWEANTKITGNVSISNNCVVTVKGNVWITGTLNTSNSTQMRVDNSVGTIIPIIMVDGSGGATFSNSSNLVSNSSSTGFQIITFWSQASCSPNCADVTGTDLYNSRNTETIRLNNSAQGANTIFYSRWSKVNVSNSGQIGALIGQVIQLSNSGTITFGTSTGTGTTTWVVSDYRRSF
jgi:hypothetical protein